MNQSSWDDKFMKGTCSSFLNYTGSTHQAKTNAGGHKVNTVLNNVVVTENFHCWLFSISKESESLNKVIQSA